MDKTGDIIVFLNGKWGFSERIFSFCTLFDAVSLKTETRLGRKRDASTYMDEAGRLRPVLYFFNFNRTTLGQWGTKIMIIESE